MLLFNPGPVVLSQRVRQSLSGPDICHREPEFTDLQSEVRSSILRVYGLSPDEWVSVLLTGSGTAAVESMVVSLLPSEGKILIAVNGTYGERIAAICKQYGLPHVVATHGVLEAIDLNRIRDVLRADGAITHLALVHHETTTGRLNELTQIGELCTEHGVKLLLDAVSSFGAEGIDFSQPIDALAVSANKCLHGVPGLSFVLVRRSALIQARQRCYFLDLSRQASQQDKGSTSFTPAVQAYYALVEALRELEEQGGWRARHARYAVLAERVRQGLEDLGISHVLPVSSSSVVLRSYNVPPQLTYQTLHDSLKEKGVVIYAGQDALMNKIFRVSTMGAIDEADIDFFLNAVATQQATLTEMS